ncbi:MAG: VCBS repeat-containing protein [Acetobacteraceae bacterium]|nr:VCBS repeat-containing protein [Acetobacteraceae bacterium]
MAFSYSVILNDTQNLGAALDAGLVADMNAALDDWSRYIAGIGTLIVQLNITPTTRENGGSASSVFVRADGSRNLFMPSSIYELTTGQHAAGTTSDIVVNVDPTYLRGSVWVNPNPNAAAAIPGNLQDQVSIFRHEIGHGLGIGGFTSGNGNLGRAEYLWDTYLQKDSATIVWFVGPNAVAAYGGKVPVTTLANGEAYFHLANSIGEPLGQDLMNGVAFNGGISYDISDIDLAILKDLGVPISNSTALRTGGATASLPPLNLTAAVTLAGRMGQEWTAFAAADFTGAGKGDIAWRDASGRISDWTLDGGRITGVALDDGKMGVEWQVAGSNDFNNDGRADLVWRDNGNLAVWLMNGSHVAGSGSVNGHMGTEWQVAGTGDVNGDGRGDVNGDGRGDVIWTNGNGQIAIWELDGSRLAAFATTSGRMGTEWRFAGTGDFNGDGRDDLLWANNSGQVAEWTMNGTNIAGVATSSGRNGGEWQVAAVADFNRDDIADILWQSTGGKVEMWFMRGATVTKVVPLTGQMGAEWHIAGVRDLTGGGTPDIVWANDTGQTTAWLLDAVGGTLTGGGSQSTFTFNQLAEGGMEITDFQAGAGGGTLNLRGLLASIGYSGGNPLGDGEIRLVQSGANTSVQIDAHPGTRDYVAVVTLDNVAAGAMTPGNFMF